MGVAGTNDDIRVFHQPDWAAKLGEAHTLSIPTLSAIWYMDDVPASEVPRSKLSAWYPRVEGGQENYAKAVEVAGGIGIIAGCTAVETSTERTRTACQPRRDGTASQTIRAPSKTASNPSRRRQLTCKSTS